MTEYVDSLQLSLKSRQAELREELEVVSAALEALGGVGGPTPAPPPAPRQVETRKRIRVDVPQDHETLKRLIRGWASDPDRGMFTVAECVDAVYATSIPQVRGILNRLTADDGLMRVMHVGGPARYQWESLPEAEPPVEWAKISHVGEGYAPQPISNPDELDPSVEAALEPRPERLPPNDLPG